MIDDSTVPAEVLAAFGLEGQAPERLEQGLVNAHWKAGEVVLRRYHRFGTPESVEWEHQLVEHARNRGWPVPVALAARTGGTVLETGGRLWSAAQFLPGTPGTPDSAAGYQIQGRLLARIHRDLASFPRAEQRPGLGKAWELDAWVAAAGAGTFNDLVGTFAAEHPDVAGLIRRQRYRSLRELSRLRYPDLPDLPVHGDFQRFNLLWRDGQVTGILDFDQSRLDAQLCDIAVVLMPFMPLDLKFARAFLDGYETVRPLTSTEWALLPALVRASLLRWVAFLLVRWRTDGVPADPILRTMTVRFPAFEQVERSLELLSARSG